MKISFCTTCKGRLWQLEQTLPRNVKRLREGTELIILDYQSPDNLREYLFNNYAEYLDNGKIKYYYLTHAYNYTSAYAKNVAHRLASGEILFNLDGDNLIRTSLEDLLKLKPNELYVPRLSASSIDNEGTFGRLGYHKELFYRFNGYNENLVGMVADDGELMCRMIDHGVKRKVSAHFDKAIQNTPEQKQLYVNVPGLTNPPLDYPKHWGQAVVADRFGNLIELGF